MTVKQSDYRFAGLVRNATVAALLLAGAVALSACKSNSAGTPDAYAADEPAGDLYNEGLAYMNAGKTRQAKESFEEVDRQHPYSEHARKALIMSAFTSYRRREY
jgi:outer membrane protein assembly factor BamD